MNLITKEDKPHTIGENLDKPPPLKMTTVVLGKTAENKFYKISISKDTISSRIDDMSDNIWFKKLKI